MINGRLSALRIVTVRMHLTCINPCHVQLVHPFFHLRLMRSHLEVSEDECSARFRQRCHMSGQVLEHVVSVHLDPDPFSVELKIQIDDVLPSVLPCLHAYCVCAGEVLCGQSGRA